MIIRLARLIRAGSSSLTNNSDDIVLSQSVSYTNGNVREFLPLSNATDLPSRRNDTGARHLLLAFSDTILAGDQSNPWVLTLRGSYRGDTSETRPAHPEAGVGTTFQMFSSNNTGGLFGNLGSFGFGNPTSTYSVGPEVHVCCQQMPTSFSAITTLSLVGTSCARESMGLSRKF